MDNTFHNKLKKLMDKYAHSVYNITSSFPKDEIYGITSQLRRSSLSIILNYIEGYSRFKRKVLINFLETSYGSLKESKYLLDFCYKEQLITNNKYDKLNTLAEEIGAMLWTDIKNKKSKDC